MSYFDAQNCLLKYSEIGKAKKVKELFSKLMFQENVIDKSFRRCLYKFDKKNNQFLEVIKELLEHANLNYINESDNGSTPILKICEKGDISILNLIIFISKKRKFELDLSISDNNKKSLIHYILNAQNYLNEENMISLIKTIFDYNESIGQKKIKNSDFLILRDDKGETFLTLVLKNARYKLLTNFIEFISCKKYIIPHSRNNLLHCAVEGGSYLCLKKMLIYSNSEDLTHKNKEGFNPVNLANSRKKYFLAKILAFYENYTYNYQFKELFSKNHINTLSILNSFLHSQYIQTLNMLLIYKLNLNILSEITNLSCEWNIFLTKKYLYLLKGITPEHILSKYLQKNNSSINFENKRPNNLIEFSKFFNKFLDNLNIIDHIDEENYPIDIIIYNKVIYYLKIGNYDKVRETIVLYLTHIFCQNNENYYKWIIFVNFTFILIEYYLFVDQELIGKFLLDKLETFLLDNSKNKTNCENENIVNFLKENEIINQFSSKWEESFLYINILKNISNKNKCIVSEYENSNLICNYTGDIKILHRLKFIIKMIKVKYNYHKNNLNKCFEKILLIKQLYFDLSYEHKLFYYNSLGILNLKLGNYYTAEVMFRKGIEINRSIQYNFYYNKNYKNNNTDKSLYIQKMNNILYIKYNLALSLFYQKRYQEANSLLKELISIKSMKKNLFLWYRLGLTYLELYIANSKKEYYEQNSIYTKTYGYKNNKKRSTCIDDNISIFSGSYCSFSYDNNSNNNNNSDSEIDELFDQFEKQNCHFDKLHKVNKNPLKRIILKGKSCNLSNVKINSHELKQAIYCFKNIIILNKCYENKCENSNENKILKSILKFYDEDNNKNKLFLSNQYNIQLINSCYSNLIFCLSLNKNYNEVLYYINEVINSNSTLINNNNKIILTDELFIKLNSYKIEALFNLNRDKEAYSCIKDVILKYENINLNYDVFDKSNFSIIQSLEFKINYSEGLFLYYYKIKNYEEMENRYNNMIKNYFRNTKFIPNHLIKLGILIYLIQKNKNYNNIYQLIKHRKIYNFYKQDDKN